MKLKKGVKRALILILVLIVVVTVSLFLLNRKTENKPTGPSITVESNIDEYGYELKSNQTKLYKDLFKELEKVLSQETVNEEEYVTVLTKLFIADFYNLDNKLTNMDIGGVQFVHSSMQENFALNAENTMYQYVQSNIYGDRKQELPKVKEIVSVEVTQDSYKYQDTTDEKAFVVKATWSYEKDLGYETEKTFIFVHEDKKLSLVEMK